MELFDRKSVSKFFKLLCNKSTFTDTLYNKSLSKVFVERTLNKWFSGKFIIYYNQDGYKEYLYILNVKFYYYGKVEIEYLDYSNPKKLNNFRIFTGSDDYYGEWCKDDKSKHLNLIEMFKLPKQEFKFIKVNSEQSVKIAKLKLNENYTFQETLKEIGEEITIESTTYDKALQIAKDFAKQDKEYSQIYEI